MMLKVLYLPLNTPGNTQTGMYDAWNNVGAQLHVFDFYMRYLEHKNVSQTRREFLSMVDNLRPDLVHMQLQFTGVLDFETLYKAKTISPSTVFINWMGDIRKDISRDFLTLSPAIDYSFQSNVGQIEMYRQAGCKNCHYWQVGYDPKLFYPKGETSFKYDVVFTANMYDLNMFPDVRLRLEMARALKKRFGARAGVFGSGYPNDLGRISKISPYELNDLYNSSLTVLSVSNFNDVSHYFSDRLLACIGSGRPTISYRFPGIESYFADKFDILVSHSIPETIQLVEECMRNPEKATQIGRNGHIKVKNEHTFTSRVLELVKMVNLSDKL